MLTDTSAYSYICYILVFDNSFAVMPNTETCASLVSPSAVGLYDDSVSIYHHMTTTADTSYPSPSLFRIKRTPVLRQAQASCVCRRQRIQ